VPPATPLPAHLRRILDLFDRERQSLFLAGVEGQRLPRVTRLHGKAGDWHQIAYSSLSSADADAIIAEQVEHYRALGSGVEWAAYEHDAPRDLLERLVAHGFEVGPREAVVVLDCERQPSWLSAPCPYRVERVCSAEDLATFAATAEQIFGTDQTPVVREIAARLSEGSDEHIAYLVYDELGSVASVARVYTHPQSQFAGLYGGGTLASHRGQGLYRAGVRRRALDALALGARYLRVDALPTSQPILERLGFEVLTYVWPCVLIE
jgi:hypothetical protein